MERLEEYDGVVSAGTGTWGAVVSIRAGSAGDAANAWPTLPELVSVPEAAGLLGVSPQRVHELAAHHASFPEPMYELRTGKLWLRDAIDVFAQRWERKPGRPRKAQTSLSHDALARH